MPDEKTPREQLRETLEKNRENMKQWPRWIQDTPETNWWRVLTLVEQWTLQKISRDPGARPPLEIAYRLFSLGLIVQSFEKDPNPMYNARMVWRMTSRGESVLRKLEGMEVERHYSVTEDPKDPQTGA